MVSSAPLDIDDRFGEPPAAPAWLEISAPATIPVRPLPATLDDSGTAYVLVMQPAFDLVRQAVGQLAGLLVLAAAGGKSAAGHPMLAPAADALAQAAETIHSVRVPASARHHHRHLVAAERLALESVALARRIAGPDDTTAMDRALGALRAAHRHLLWATNALPGFEIVALGQSCCAEHARSAGATPT